MLLDNKEKCRSSSPNFIYDEACLDILNLLNENVTVYGQYVECLGCDFKDYGTLAPNQNMTLLVNTKYSKQMFFVHDDKTFCRWNAELLEHYRYGWNLTDKCVPLYIKQSADNAYLPILTAFIILFFFGTLWYMVKCIYKCTRNREIWRRYFNFSAEIRHVNTVLYFDDDNVNDLGRPSSDTAPLVIERPPVRKHPNRIKSIDVFRGLCIVLMIFVNYGGGQYWIFKHSVWNGLTIADLVFPWFIWVMGLSYSVSLNNKLRRAVPRRQLIFQVIRRSFLLILFGIIISAHGGKTDLSDLRFPGVLQRIGVTYFFIGMIESIFAKRTYGAEPYGRLEFLQDLLMSWPQWLIILGFITAHTLVTFVVYVPGCGRGYLGPGGIHNGGRYFNCTGGVAGYIDRSVFGDEHIYHNPTCRRIYETTENYDPEGILGILTSVVLAYLGVHAGRILNVFTSINGKIIRWSLWGLIISFLGSVLCNFSKNGGPIPINKNLWSLSFVLVLGGLAFLIQAFLLYLVDVKRKWGGRPFFYPGMNPLILYIGHELLKDTFPFGWKPSIKTHGMYLGMNLWGTALWVAISIFLYKKNIFLHI